MPRKFRSFRADCIVGIDRVAGELNAPVASVVETPPSAVEALLKAMVECVSVDSSGIRDTAADSVLRVVGPVSADGRIDQRRSDVVVDAAAVARYIIVGDRRRDQPQNSVETNYKCRRRVPQRHTADVHFD